MHAQAQHARARNAVRILLVGNDGILLETRQRILESAGYFASTISVPDFREQGHVPATDLALLCHTIPETMLREIVARLRQSEPSPKILLVERAERSLAAFGLCLSTSPTHPVALLARVRALLDRS